MCFGVCEKGDEVGVVRLCELDKIICVDEKKMLKEVKLLLLGMDVLVWFIVLFVVILIVLNRSG